MASGVGIVPHGVGAKACGPFFGGELWISPIVMSPKLITLPPNAAPLILPSYEIAKFQFP